MATFKNSMDRLDEIVTLLERNEIELEEAIKLFEEGLTLIKNCDVQLKSFETKVGNMIKEFENGDNNE